MGKAYVVSRAENRVFNQAMLTKQFAWMAKMGEHHDCIEGVYGDEKKARKVALKLSLMKYKDDVHGSEYWESRLKVIDNPETNFDACMVKVDTWDLTRGRLTGSWSPPERPSPSSAPGKLKEEAEKADLAEYMDRVTKLKRQLLMTGESE